MILNGAFLSDHGSQADAVAAAYTAAGEAEACGHKVQVVALANPPAAQIEPCGD